MEQHSLIRLRKVENVTDLLCAPPFDVAETDYGTLRRRQLGDRVLDNGARLRGQQALFRPGIRRRDPVASAREAVEPDRLLGRPLARAETRERNRPAFPLGARLRRVREDPED